MTKIYLIRHAEAEGNLYRIAHGWHNGLITNYRGYQQIDALRQRFQDVDIDAVYASDLYRTQITARAIWLPKALPLHLEPAFREIHMGVWEDHPWHELNKLHPEEMYHFNRRVDLWRVEGGETAQDVLDRYIPALHRIGAAHDGGTVAVFSHGAALRIVLGTLQGVPLSGIGDTPHGDNTAVSLLTWDDGALRVEYRDDNSHLTERGLSTFARQSWWRSAKMVDPGEDYVPLPEELRRAYLDGDWDVLAGQFFREFSRTRHVIEPFELPSWWRRFRSIDWGYNDPCAVLWHAVDGEGRVYTYRELYLRYTRADQVAERIRRESEGEDIAYTVASPDMWQKRGAVLKANGGFEGESIAELFSLSGVPLTPADNSRIAGWQRVRSYLADAPDGEPRLKIFSCCENLIRTLPGLIFDEHDREDAEQGEDHAPESLRYALMSRPAVSAEPRRRSSPAYDPFSEEPEGKGGFLAK